jgi:uncharacterized protein (UPF0332 family)
MIDEKKLKEAERRVKQYLKDGTIKTKGNKAFTDFFTRNSMESLDVAAALYALSTDGEKQKILGFASFNGLLWVVNASYYSMFYMARAVLENSGIQIRTEQSVHAVTFDALVCFFYLTGKLQKSLIENYAEATDEVTELLGQERANRLIQDYFNERDKRTKFTYEMGEMVIQNKAKTSLERAKNFNKELRKTIEKR